MDYIPTIGLEIHAELKTRTKMFCDSKNDPQESRPNVNICPVCLAHPGTLPVINREAIKHVLRVGLAVGGTLADYTEFDRKNYFYPDLPKGYQISQYEHPLVSGGELLGVPITRIHLEEDTASSAHDEDEGSTAIDFNRAGVPLMELVTEPSIHSAEKAGEFARELQLILRSLGVSDADMEKGQMRVEANVSISVSDTLGTKVEIKNLNSFRTMERAVLYEIQRQRDMLERGESVVQETRGWNERTQSTFSQRSKEGSADYRYFPDPDLPSLMLSEVPGFQDSELKKTLTELPGARRARYEAMGIKKEDAAMFVRESRLGSFFEASTAALSTGDRRVLLAANYIANDLAGITRLTEAESRQTRDIDMRDTEMHNEVPISVDHFREIIDLVAENRISSRSAKDLLVISVQEKRSPNELAKGRGLLQSSDVDAIRSAVLAVMQAHEKVVSDYKKGKAAALGFLVGAVMKQLRGSGDPKIIRETLLSELN